MILNGKFQKIIQRDYCSGNALFSVVPEECISGISLSGGTLLCKGIVPDYLPDTFLCLDGEIQSAPTRCTHWTHTFSEHVEQRYFVCHSCTIPIQTEENVRHFISCLAPEINERNKKSIAQGVCSCCEGIPGRNRLFQFLEQNSIFDFLADDSQKREVQTFLHNVQILQRDEKMMQELTSFSIPYTVTLKLAKKGVRLENLQKNPYTILLGFKTPLQATDAYALNRCGFSPYSPKRFCAIVRVALETSLSQGDTCIDFNSFLKLTNRLFSHLSSERRESDLSSERRESDKIGKIPPALLYYCITELSDFCRFHHVNGTEMLYINHVWEEENTAIHHLMRLARGSRKTDCAISLDSVERESGLHYNKEQRKAFSLLCSTGVKILTGPPGSGKTALIRGLIRIFSENHLGKIALAATTGMAAKVMSSACGITDSGECAATVHVMLGISCMEDGTILGRTLNDPVDASLVIVDEMSMMDLQIFSSLVSAIRNDTILLLVGDDHQLESVGYGNVFQDLISSGLFETYRLKKVLRQSENIIVANAIKINRGDTHLQQNHAFQIFPCQSDAEVCHLIEAGRLGADSRRNLILAPMRTKGVCSVAHLNTILQKQNPKIFQQQYLSYGDKRFYIGDRVIFLQNDYDLGVVNGDNGEILSLDPLMVRTEHKVITLQTSDLQNIDLAYALTIHKSQGSEKENVFLVLPEDASHMMTRRLLYTAVTRAKGKVVIYSVNHALEKAIENSQEKPRRTLLKTRLLQSFQCSCT